VLTLILFPARHLQRVREATIAIVIPIFVLILFISSLFFALNREFCALFKA